MIISLKPYPAYKDSGVEWLGEVPEHWEASRFGGFGRFLRGTGGTKADDVSDGIPCIRYGDLYTQHSFFIERSRSFIAPERLSDYTPIIYRDVLFAGSGETIEEIGKSAVNLIKTTACCGGDIILFRPSREFDPRFLGYVSDYPRSAYQKACMGRGVTVMHIYAEKLRNLWIAIPPLSEQTAIVRFLDYMDRRVQRYIRAKQKLIVLLNEQKQAITHHAVTRGLDPNVRLKPSGVEWLEDIPEHWSIRRIKSELWNLNNRRVPLSSSERGRMTSRRYDYYGASGVIDKVDDYLFDDELLLIAEDGANLVLRNLPLVIIARGKFWVNNHAHILKPRNGSLQYFAALLECIGYKPWITGAAQPKLTQERLMAIRIPVPPQNEQEDIAAWIKANTVEIEFAVDKARREVDLLREYRTRIIADVVTGKIDVGEVAARLPDEAGEEEVIIEEESPLDEEGIESGGFEDMTEVD